MLALLKNGEIVNKESHKENIEKIKVVSRDIIINKLIEDGDFCFYGYIQNEVNTSKVTLFKAIARYFNISFDQANKITTSNTCIEKFNEKTYTGWLKKVCNDFQFDWEDHWDLVESKMEFCYNMAKIPQGISIAASGVIMSDEEVILPVHTDFDSKVISIAYNSKDLESWGFTKFDILTVTTLNQIQYFKGASFEWDDCHDPKVWDIICAGETDFVFQFGSGPMKSLCKNTKPRTTQALGELNALYRPGPIEMGLVDKYTQMKTNDPEFKLTPTEEALFAILKEEFGEGHCGLIIFQEDLMKIFQVCAGFSLSEADDIRKAMSKKDEALLDTYKGQFVEGWNEIMGEQYNADDMWDTIYGFAKYAFNKSHSISYAIVAYWCAWMYCYHFDELMEFCLNYDSNVYDIAINKCKEKNYRFVYPTIGNGSGLEIKINDGKIFLPSKLTKSYDSFPEFLFGDHDTSIANQILMGLCDNLTKDRSTLLDLVTLCLKRAKDKAQFMESYPGEFTSLIDILDGLILCGGVVSYEIKNSKEIFVKVMRARGEPSEILFRSNDSESVRAENIGFDKKFFGMIRPGYISDMPYERTEPIEIFIEKTKEKNFDKYQDKENVKDIVYNAIKADLDDFMYQRYKHISDLLFNKGYGKSIDLDKVNYDEKGVYENVYAILEDSMSYDNSTKLTLTFNDKRDIFYIYDKKLREKVLTFGKKPVVKLSMMFSPFINKKNLQFIYDLDILTIDEIKGGQ